MKSQPAAPPKPRRMQACPAHTALVLNKHITIGNLYTCSQQGGKVLKLVKVDNEGALFVYTPLLGAAEEVVVKLDNLKSMRPSKQKEQTACRSSVAKGLLPQNSEALQEMEAVSKAQPEEVQSQAVSADVHWCSQPLQGPCCKQAPQACVWQGCLHSVPAQVVARLCKAGTRAVHDEPFLVGEDNIRGGQGQYGQKANHYRQNGDTCKAVEGAQGDRGASWLAGCGVGENQGTKFFVYHAPHIFSKPSRLVLSQPLGLMFNQPSCSVSL